MIIFEFIDCKCWVYKFENINVYFVKIINVYFVLYIIFIKSSPIMDFNDSESEAEAESEKISEI